MKQLLQNLPFFAVLASALFLLMHEHYVAGGFLVVVSGQLARVD